MTTRRRGEQGQMLIIAAMMMPVMLGFLGLVIDVGHAYGNRRLMQNASDAASIAAARQLAASMQSGVADNTIVGILNTYLTANGGATFTSAAPLGAVEGAWYVAPNGARVASVGSGYNVPPVPVGGAPTVAGVEVVAHRDVETFFATMLGFDTFAVSATSTARYGGQASQSLQPPNGANVMPFVVDLRTYNQSLATCGAFSGNRITFTLNVDAPFSCSGGTGAGGFNWSPLNQTDASSNRVVQDLLNPTSNRANNEIRIGDPVEIPGGERATDYRQLDENYQGQDVIVPLVADTTATSCPGCSMPLIQFAWFHVYRANGHGNPKTISGWWIDPRTKPPVGGRQLGTSSTIAGPVTFALTR